MTHICVRKITIIGSDNGLSPGRRQAIIWTNVGILLIGPLGTNFSEILIEIYIFSFKKMNLKMLSGKWRPFCLCLNVLSNCLDACITPLSPNLTCYGNEEQNHCFHHTLSNPDLGICYSPTLIIKICKFYHVFSCSMNNNGQITMKLCTCHDSHAVMACAKFHCVYTSPNQSRWSNFSVTSSLIISETLQNWLIAPEMTRPQSRFHFRW